MNEETQQQVVKALQDMTNGLVQIRAAIEDLDAALNPDDTPKTVRGGGSGMVQAADMRPASAKEPRLIGFTPNRERA